jgi:hypothetical protein
MGFAGLSVTKTWGQAMAWAQNSAEPPGLVIWKLTELHYGLWMLMMIHHDPPAIGINKYIYTHIYIYIYTTQYNRIWINSRVNVYFVLARPCKMTSNASFICNGVSCCIDIKWHKVMWSRLNGTKPKSAECQWKCVCENPVGQHQGIQLEVLNWLSCPLQLWRCM